MSDLAQDLRQETREVANLIATIRAACGGDVEAFTDTLDGETGVVDAASRVLRWAFEQEAQANACKALAAYYTERKDMFEERYERGCLGLFHFLNEIGQRSMPLPEATISIRAGAPQVVGAADVNSLPDHLVRTTREPNKAAINAAVKAGEKVAGYSLSNAAPTLSVRRR